jgi:hypothetical protein
VWIPDAECVLDPVEGNLDVSIRQIATMLNIVKMIIWIVLHEQLLYQHHYSKFLFQFFLSFFSFFPPPLPVLPPVLISDKAGFGVYIISFHNDH